MTCEACATTEEFPALFQAGCKACEQRMRATLKQTKPKTCNKRKGGCGGRFIPRRPMQSACSPECAREMARAKREQDELKKARETRKVDRERREKLKKLSELASDAQAIVNKYVRLRDAKDGCISCNKPASWDGQWHASHFRSVGAASAVRFNLWNIHKSCSVCNHHKSGNIADYTPRIVEKIGQEKVDWLKSQNQTVRYTREYLSRLKRVFAKKVSRLQKRLAQ